MLSTTDKLVRQHMTYLLSLDDITTELSKFETLYDHILYYSIVVLQMNVDDALHAINDFLTNSEFLDPLEENSLSYRIQY